MKIKGKLSKPLPPIPNVGLNVPDVKGYPNSKLQEAKYPCKMCGKLRTKDEGGTIFTVCDECWEKTHPKPQPEELEEDIRNIGIDLVDKHFPKGECKERGKAIVLYALLVIRFMDKIRYLRKEK